MVSYAPEQIKIGTYVNPPVKLSPVWYIILAIAFYYFFMRK